MRKLEKQNVKIDMSGSSLKLRKLATEARSVMPRFRDLGEATVDGKNEYRVECIWRDVSETGHGIDRKEARECAAYLVLSRVEQSTKSHDKAKQKTKNTTVHRRK